MVKVLFINYIVYDNIHNIFMCIVFVNIVYNFYKYIKKFNIDGRTKRQKFTFDCGKTS